MRRLPSLVLAGLLLGVLTWALPAAADDELPPPAYPSGLPNPGDIGNEVPEGGYTPGPTIVITPGSTGTALPAPTTAATTTPAAPTSGGTTDATPGADPASADGAAGPEAGPRTAAVVRDPGTPAWLAVAAGLIVLVGLLATFGGIARRRVTRDPASR